MIKSYRLIQHWNEWLTQSLGIELLDAEYKILSDFLQGGYGKQVALIGAPQQQTLLKNMIHSTLFLITPIMQRPHSIRLIESDWYELPVRSGSVDWVILPHTLEHVDNPRQVLSEACRILKAEGSIIIFGFNPYSLWSLQRALKRSLLPTKSNTVAASAVKQWLKLEEFELTKQKSFLYRPLTSHPELFHKLKLLDWVGEKCHLPMGAAYALMAKAKVVPLTPIRLHWKQSLATMRATIPGQIMRNNYK